MVNTTVNLSEAQSQLSQFVERAAAGEEIIILKDGRPLAGHGMRLIFCPVHTRSQKRAMMSMGGFTKSKKPIISPAIPG